VVTLDFSADLIAFWQERHLCTLTTLRADGSPHVVPVGVDPDLFRPIPGIERIPGRLVTTASADVTMKGLRYLLEALAKLRTERDVSLVVIGKPKEGGRSAETIAKLGLTDIVSFVSGVSDERIYEMYSEAELAIVPSLYEGFSLPAIEAMSCGVALVSTTGGALPEVVGADGDTALLVGPGDSEALAAKIRSRGGDVHPMQLAALLLENVTQNLSDEDVLDLFDEGR
jgi:glycosyltransferase involved in cell wall biosynthesis